ncbi:MAG: IS21/IS408/IS1162 family transposase [Candidatus Dormibacterales bacterium]
MEILEAFDLTRNAWSAAQLAGCDPKTVAHYVARRDAGYDPYRRARRARLVDFYAEKIEELVDHSHAKVRADVVYDRLVAMGFAGDERTIRRAVAEAKVQFRNGHRRTYRPWIPEPGMWLQYDWGWGPVIELRQTYLFCAWLAWCRYRVIIPTWDRTLGTVLSCLDNTLRRLGGAPTYLLTDNERTLTSDRVAGVPVRHPDLVAAGRHYGLKVETCTPHDPETKGGSEATVRVAKADLVPTDANLLPTYGHFKSLVVACEETMVELNERPHRATRRAPMEMLAEERQHLHTLPPEPYAAALGETRTVRDDQTVHLGDVPYSTPPGHVGQEVWVRVEGEEMVVVGRDRVGHLVEIIRHELSTPGRPRILDEHYPDHPNGRGVKAPKLRPRTASEQAFLDIGPGAERWLRAAAASGIGRIRSKMSRAVELAALCGRERVDEALARAAESERFGENDLASILEHIDRPPLHLLGADERFSVQRGTGAWKEFGK